MEQLPCYFNVSLPTELLAEKVHQWFYLTCKNIIWVFKSACPLILTVWRQPLFRAYIRTLRALKGLNGCDQPHLGSPSTAPASGPGAPFKISSGSSALAWATSLSVPTSSPGPGSCLCAWLDPSPKRQYHCSPVQTLLPGWTSDTRCSLSPNLSLVPFASDWTPWTDLGLAHDFAMSGTVNGPYYQHPGLLKYRCCGTVLWSARAISLLGSPSASSLTYLQEQPALAAPWHFASQ